MRPQKQKNRHRPEEGIYGDCHRTCLAMLLDRDRDEVPNFAEQAPDDGEGFNVLVNQWLEEQGYTSFNVPFAAPLEEVLNFMRVVNPGIFYILGGQSRTGVNHSVIGFNDAIVADPSLNDSGIVGPTEPDGHYWVTVLVPAVLVNRLNLPAPDLAYKGLQE